MRSSLVRIAALYKFGIEWTQAVRLAHVPPVLRKAQLEMAKFSRSLITQIEYISHTLDEALRDCEARIAAGECIKVDVYPVLSLDAKGFSEALAEAAKRIQMGQLEVSDDEP